MKETDNLSAKAKYELGYIIYSGLSEAIDNNKMDKDVLEELLNCYKDNVMISYSNLKEKFDSIKWGMDFIFFIESFPSFVLNYLS